MSDKLINEIFELRRQGLIQTDLEKAAEAQLYELAKQGADPMGRELWESILKPSSGYAGMVRPILAVLGGASLLGAAHAMTAAKAPGAEREVLSRFKQEFMATNRSERDWDEQGVEDRVRQLYGDLRGMAPDVATNPSMALAVIRAPALRKLQPNFTKDEVKEILDKQKTMRDIRPTGSQSLQNIKTIAGLIPDAVSVFG